MDVETYDPECVVEFSSRYGDRQEYYIGGGRYAYIGSAGDSLRGLCDLATLNADPCLYFVSICDDRFGCTADIMAKAGNALWEEYGEE